MCRYGSSMGARARIDFEKCPVAPIDLAKNLVVAMNFDFFVLLASLIFYALTSNN